MKLITEDGYLVLYNKSHLIVHADVLQYLEEAIKRINTNGDKFIKIAIDFGKHIGHSTCVKTNKSDTIKYATRIGRKYPTRFVVNRKSEPSSTITVIMKRTKVNYILLTAYIGELAAKEVHDPTLDYQEAHESNEFWSNHALIWDESIIEKIK